MVETTLKVNDMTSGGPTPAQLDPGHTLQFYSDDASLLDPLENSITRAVKAGNAFICVLTRTHAAGLAKLFELRGHDMTIPIEQARYIPLDADKVVSAVMPEGRFEPLHFSELFGREIRKARSAIGPRSSTISLFGEGVAVACARGAHKEVVRWERAVNALSIPHLASVGCGYSTGTFDCYQENSDYNLICGAHSSIMVPAGLTVVLGKEHDSATKIELKQVFDLADRLTQGEMSSNWPTWQSHYRAALLETNQMKLFKRVEVAEAAVLTRIQRFRTAKEKQDERHDLLNAWTGLQLIKKKKLGFV
jgi:hypothetical protein